MSNKITNIEGLRLAALRSKGYTDEQIAEITEALQNAVSELQQKISAKISTETGTELPTDNLTNGDL